MVHRSGSSIALAPTSLNTKTENDNKNDNKKCDLKNESTVSKITTTNQNSRKSINIDDNNTQLSPTSSSSSSSLQKNKRSTSLTKISGITKNATISATNAASSEKAQIKRSIQKALSPPVTPNDANLRITPTARGRSRSVVHSNPPTPTPSLSSSISTLSSSSIIAAALNNNSNNNKKASTALRQCTPTPPIRNRRNRLSVDFDLNSDASSNCSSILSSITPSSTRSGLRSHSLDNATTYHNNNNNNNNNSNKNSTKQEFIKKSKSLTPKKITTRKSSLNKLTTDHRQQQRPNRSSSNNRSNRCKSIENKLKKCQSMDSVFQPIKLSGLNDDIHSEDDNVIDDNDDELDIKHFRGNLKDHDEDDKLLDFSTKLTCSVPLDRISSGILATLVSKYKNLGNCDDDPDDEKESSIISSNSSSVSLPSAPLSIILSENVQQQQNPQLQQQQQQKSLCLYCDKKFSSQKIRIIHTERVHTIQGSSLTKTRRISSRSISTALSSSSSNLTNISNNTIITNNSNSISSNNNNSSSTSNLTKQFHSGCSYCCKTNKQQQGQTNNNSNNTISANKSSNGSSNSNISNTFVTSTTTTSNQNTANDLKNLFNHMCEYHSDKYFACKCCAIRFQTLTDLEDHNEQFHKGDEKLLSSSVAPFTSCSLLTNSSTGINSLNDNDINTPVIDDITSPLINSSEILNKVGLKRTTLTSGGIEKIDELDSNITKPLKINTGNNYESTSIFIDPSYEQKLTRRQLKHQAFENIRAAAASSTSVVSVTTTLLTRSAAAAATAATINRGGDETNVTRLNRTPRGGRKGTVRNRVNTRQNQIESSNKDNTASGLSSCTVKTRSKVGFCKLTPTDEPTLLNSLQNEQSQPAILAQRPPTGIRPEPLSCTFDDDFYETVSLNVRKNLCCHLDGKLDGGPTSPSPISPITAVPAIRSTVVKSPLNADSEIHEATTLSTLTAFPTLLTAEQYGSDYNGSSKMKRPFTKHSWKWKWDSFKKYKYVNEGGKIVKKIKQPITGLRDLSKLDMWTQLTMRTKHEFIQRKENANTVQNLGIGEIIREEKRKQIDQLNTILDTRRLPQIILEQTEQTVIKVEIPDESSTCSYYSTITTTDTTTITTSTTSQQAISFYNQELNRGIEIESSSLNKENFNVFPYFLNLRRNDPSKFSKPKQIILSGEWARPRCYICYGCGAKFDHLKTLEEHKIFRHPYVYSTHYEIVGRELIAGDLFKHFYIPTQALMRHHQYRISSSTMISKKLQVAINDEIVDSNSNSQIVGVTGSNHHVVGSNTAAAAVTAEDESMDSINSNSKSSYITSTSKSDCDTDSKLTSVTSSTYISTRSSALSNISCNQNITIVASINDDCGNNSIVRNSIENKLDATISSLHTIGEETNIDISNQIMKNCSKCKREYNGMLELYRHMLDCSGDYFWMLAKKRKYRYYGSKRRRSTKHHHFSCERRKKSSGNKSEDGGSASKRKSVYNPNTPRPPRPSDAESIARMLENLPAKRACRQIFPDLTKPRRKFKHNNSKLSVLKKSILVKKGGQRHLINSNVAQKLRNGKKIMATTSVSAITKNILRNHKKQRITRHLRQRQQKQNEENRLDRRRPKKTSTKISDESKERNKSLNCQSSSTNKKSNSDTEQKSNLQQDKRNLEIKENETKDGVKEENSTNSDKRKGDNLTKKTQRFVKKITQKLQNNKKGFMLKKKVTRSSGISPLRGLDTKDSKSSKAVSRTKNLLRKLNFRRKVEAKSIKLEKLTTQISEPKEVVKDKEILTESIAEEQVDGSSDTSSEDREAKALETIDNSSNNTSEDDNLKQGMKSKKRKAIKNFFGISGKNKKSPSPVSQVNSNSISEGSSKGNKKSSNKNHNNKLKTLSENATIDAKEEEESCNENEEIKIKIEESEDTNTKQSGEESTENNQQLSSNETQSDNGNSVQISPTAKRRGKKLNDCIAMLTGKLQEKIQASKSDIPSNDPAPNPESKNSKMTVANPPVLENTPPPTNELPQNICPPPILPPVSKPKMGFDIASLVKPDNEMSATSSSCNTNAVIISSSYNNQLLGGNESTINLNNGSDQKIISNNNTSPAKRKTHSRKNAKTHKNVEEELLPINELNKIEIENKNEILEKNKVESEKNKLEEGENSKVNQVVSEISKSLENIKEMTKDIEKTLHNPASATIQLDHSNLSANNLPSKIVNSNLSLEPLQITSTSNAISVINNNPVNSNNNSNNNLNFKPKSRKNSRSKSKETATSTITTSLPAPPPPPSHSVLPQFSIPVPVPELLPPSLLFTAKELLASQQSKLTENPVLLPSPPLLSALANIDPNNYQDLSSKLQNLESKQLTTSAPTPPQLLSLKVPDTLVNSTLGTASAKNVNEIILQKGNKLSNDLIISPIITPPSLPPATLISPNLATHNTTLNLCMSSNNNNQSSNNASSSVSNSPNIISPKKKVLTSAQKKATPQPPSIISIIPQILQQSPSLAIPLGPPTTISTLLAGSSSFPSGIISPSSITNLSLSNPRLSSPVATSVITAPGVSVTGLTSTGISTSLSCTVSQSSMLSSLPPSSHLPPPSLIQPPIPLQPAPAAASLEPCGAIDLSISQQRSTEAKLLSFMDFDVPLDLSKKSTTPSMSPLPNRKSPRAGPSPSTCSSNFSTTLPPQQSEPLALTVGKKSIEIQSLPIANSSLKIPSILNLPLLNPPSFAEELFRQKFLEPTSPNKIAQSLQIQPMQSQPINLNQAFSPQQQQQQQQQSQTPPQLTGMTNSTNSIQPPLLNIPPIPQPSMNQVSKKKRTSNNKTNQNLQTSQQQQPQQQQQQPLQTAIIKQAQQATQPSPSNIQQLYNTGNIIATNSIDEAITAVILGLDLPPEKQKEFNLGNKSESSIALFDENIQLQPDIDIKSSNIIEQINLAAPPQVTPIILPTSLPPVQPPIVENIIQISVESCHKKIKQPLKTNQETLVTPQPAIESPSTISPSLLNKTDVVPKTIDDIQNVEITSTGVIDKSTEFLETSVRTDLKTEQMKKKNATKKKKIEPNSALSTEVSPNKSNIDMDMNMVDIEEVLTENIVEKVSLDKQKENSEQKVENSNSEITSTDSLKALTSAAEKSKKGRKKSLPKVEHNEISTSSTLQEAISSEDFHLVSKPTEAFDDKLNKKKNKKTNKELNDVKDVNTKKNSKKQQKIIIEVTPDIASISTSLNCDSDFRPFMMENHDPTSSSTFDILMEDKKYQNDYSEDNSFQTDAIRDSENRENSGDNSLSSSKTDNSPGIDDKSDSKKSSLESLLKFRRKPILPPPKVIIKEKSPEPLELANNLVLTEVLQPLQPIPTKASKKSMVKTKKQTNQPDNTSLEFSSDFAKSPSPERVEIIINSPSGIVDELFKVPPEKRGRPTKASKKMDPKFVKTLEDSMESSDETKSECSESSIESTIKNKKGKKNKNFKKVCEDKESVEKQIDDKVKETDLQSKTDATDNTTTEINLEAKDINKDFEIILTEENKTNKSKAQLKKNTSKKTNLRSVDVKTSTPKNNKKLSIDITQDGDTDASQSDNDNILLKSKLKETKLQAQQKETKDVEESFIEPHKDDIETDSNSESVQVTRKKTKGTIDSKNLRKSDFDDKETKEEKEPLKLVSKRQKKTNTLSKADAEIIENSFKMGSTYMQKMLADYSATDLTPNQNLKLPITKGGRKSFDIESPLVLSPLQKRRSTRIRTPAIIASEDSQKATASESSQSPKHSHKEVTDIIASFCSDADDEDDDNKPLVKSLGKSNKKTQDNKITEKVENSTDEKCVEEKPIQDLDKKNKKRIDEEITQASKTKNKKCAKKDESKDEHFEHSETLTRNSKRAAKNKMVEVQIAEESTLDLNKIAEQKDNSDQLSEKSDEPLIKVAIKGKSSSKTKKIEMLDENCDKNNDKQKSIDKNLKEINFDNLQIKSLSVSVDDSNIKDLQSTPVRRMTRRKSVAIEKLNMYKDLDDYQLDDEITTYKPNLDLSTTKKSNKKSKNDNLQSTAKQSEQIKLLEEEVPKKRSKRLAELDSKQTVKNKESIQMNETIDYSDNNRKGKKRKANEKDSESTIEVDKDDKMDLKFEKNKSNNIKTIDNQISSNLPDPSVITLSRPDSAAKKQRKRRKNELAAIVADQLLESFKEVDKSKIDDLKMLENLAYEKSEDLLLTGMRLTPTTKRKNVIAAENKGTFLVGSKKDSKRDIKTQKGSINLEIGESNKSVALDSKLTAAEVIVGKNKKKSLEKNLLESKLIEFEMEKVQETSSKKIKDNKSKKKRDKSSEPIESSDKDTEKEENPNIPKLKPDGIESTNVNEGKLEAKPSNNNTTFGNSQFGVMAPFRTTFDSFRSLKEFGFSTMQNKSNKDKSDKNILSEDNNSNTSELDSEILSKKLKKKGEKLPQTTVANVKNKKIEKKPEENINELRSGLESFTFGKGHFGEFIPKLFGAKSFSFGTQPPIAVSSTEPELALKPHFTNITGPSAFSAVAAANNSNVLINNSTDKNSQNYTKSNMENFFLSIAQQQEQFQQMQQPKKSILRPSILASVAPTQEQNVSTAKTSIVSSRDPRLNKNKIISQDSESEQQNRLSTLRRRRSENEPQGADKNQDQESDCEELNTAFSKDKLRISKRLGSNSLKTIGPDGGNEDSSEEDNYLAQIANSVKDKIRRESDDEDFKAENDGFELAKSFLINHNRMPRRPSTSLSMRSAPNFHDDRTNDFDDVTNTELIDMDLDDDCSVYTSFSQDVRQKGKLGRRRRRRSILMTRKRRASQALDISNEIFECEICNKSFKKSNALAKHKMTLAHVSKVSEIEYLNDKKKRQEEEIRRKFGVTDEQIELEKKQEEDRKKKHLEEEQKKKEEEKREKKRYEEEKNRQEEQKRREEEKLRLFQEEIKLKEEKRRKEEEETRKAEELKRKREEEHLQRELERRRKEEEKKRREEEKRQKEEYEKRRKEEETQRKMEEEKIKLVDLKARKEEEKRRKDDDKSNKTALGSERITRGKDQKVFSLTRITEQDVREIENAVASIPGFKSTTEDEDESILQASKPNSSSNVEQNNAQSDSSTTETSSGSSSTSSSSSEEESLEKLVKTKENVKPTTTTNKVQKPTSTTNDKKLTSHNSTKNILLNQTGIEPISSPEQNFDRYPPQPQNSRLALNPEERLFYECCNMLKGSETPMVERTYPICPPTTYANFDAPPASSVQSKPITPKSSERFSYMGSEAGANFLHNNPTAYSVKSPMAHLRTSPRPAYPKIDINQFSDISSDSNPTFPKAHHPSHNIGVGNTNNLSRTSSHHVTASGKYSVYNNMDLPGNVQTGGQFSDNQLTARTFVNNSGINQTKDTLDVHACQPTTQSQALTSPAHSTSSQGSNQTQTTAYRLKTKAAMKGYDNFKISIPTVGLDMQQALQQSPRTGCKLTALAEIALLGNETPVATPNQENQMVSDVHSENENDDHNDDDDDNNNNDVEKKVQGEQKEESEDSEPIQKPVPVSKLTKKSTTSKGKLEPNIKKLSKPMKLPPPEGNLKLTLKTKGTNKQYNRKSEKEFLEESSGHANDIKITVKDKKKIKQTAIPSPALNDDANEMQPVKDTHIIKSKKDIYEFDDSEDTADKDLQEQILKSNTDKKDTQGNDVNKKQQEKQIVIPERPFKDIGLNDQEIIKFQKPNENVLSKPLQSSPAIKNDEETGSTTSYSDRDDFNYASMSDGEHDEDDDNVEEVKDKRETQVDDDDDDDDSSSEDSAVTSKTLGNKSLIMGRIFKKVTSAATSNTVATPVIEERKAALIAEKNAANNTANKGNRGKKPKLPKEELNKLFDQLRSTKDDSGANASTGKGKNKKDNKRESNQTVIQKKSTINNNKKIVGSNSNHPMSRTQTPIDNNRSRQQRLNKQLENNKVLEQQKSDKKEDRYCKTTETTNNSLKKKTQKGTKLDTTALPMGESRAQSREIAKLQTELGMSAEEIVELISDGKRKSQRRCVSNRPKNIELWSSDEYEEFQSTKDIIALIEEKEKRNVKRRKESQASSRKSSISRSGDRSTIKYVVEDEKSRQDHQNNSEIQTETKQTKKTTTVKEKVAKNQKKVQEVRFKGEKNNGNKEKLPKSSTVVSSPPIPIELNEKSNQSKKALKTVLPTLKPTLKPKTSESESDFESELKSRGKIKKRRKTVVATSKEEILLQESEPLKPSSANSKKKTIPASIEPSKTSHSNEDSKHHKLSSTSTTTVIPNNVSSNNSNINSGNKNINKISAPPFIGGSNISTSGKITSTKPSKNKKGRPTNSSGKPLPRRKRVASEMLYYWSSSSSDDEYGRVEGNEEEDDQISGEQYQQHGWIVGDSHKKLVTLLAIAKTQKKVEDGGVKETGSKKK